MSRWSQRVGVLTLLVSVPSLANPAWAVAQDAGRGLDYRNSLEIPLTLGAAAASLLPRLFADDDATWSCRWCDAEPGGRVTLNGLDASARRSFRWDDPERAATLSDLTMVLSFAGPVTILAVGHGGFGDGFADEMGIVAEAAALQMVVTQATKFLLRRSRPWALFDQPPEGERLGSPESVSSFASGHTSWAFAVAVAAGSVASLRDDPHKEWVWAAGLTAATATAYLRVAADRHYLTDVLAGAALGSAAGWIVPRMIDR